MRRVKVFAGSSHAELSGLILERLGVSAAPAVVKRYVVLMCVCV
jgi:phosphoribosylpyrophosphate synthetase